MATENAQITSVLDLSDEEIMNLDPASLSAAPAQPDASAEAKDGAADAQDQADSQTNDDDQDAGNADDDQDPAQDATAGSQAGQGGNDQTPADKASATDAAPADTDAGKKADAGKAADKPADPATPAADDGSLKEFQAKILAPFKANGRDMQVRDADEAIALMQKGANYHKKMEQLKPQLAIVESLKKADLLDQSKIDFLIDVALKKPEAISKLVQDSGIDPLDLTAEKAGGYKPTSHKVSAQEQAIDEVWSELEGTEGFDRTANLVTKEWDVASQGVIAAHPHLLRVLTAQMQNGMYDLVSAEMNRERVLGRLTGLSDLDAYRQVGDAMEAAGKFKHLEKPAGQPTPSGQGTPAVPPVVKPNPKQAEDSNRNDKKRAASPARTTPAPAKATVKPLALSDEEIMSGKFG